MQQEMTYTYVKFLGARNKQGKFRPERPLTAVRAGPHEHCVLAALLSGATPDHPIPHLQHLADRAQVPCDSQTKYPTLDSRQTAPVQPDQLARCQSPPHMSCEPSHHLAAPADMKTQGDPAHRAPAGRPRQQKSSSCCYNPVVVCTSALTSCAHCCTSRRESTCKLRSLQPTGRPRSRCSFTDFLRTILCLLSAVDTLAAHTQQRPGCDSCFCAGPAP